MATLDGVIAGLRENDAAAEQRNQEQLGQLVTLNKQFDKYFKSLSAQAGDKLEEEREKKKEKASAGRGDLVAGAAAVTGSSLGVIAASLVAAGAAVIGAVAGIFRGFVDSLDLFTKGFFSKKIKSITDGISSLFSRIGGAFKTEGKLFDNALKPLKDAFSNFKLGFTKVGTTVSSFGKEITLVADDFSTFAGKLGTKFAVFRPAFDNFVALIDDVKGVFSKAGTVADGAKSALGFLDTLQPIIKPFFAVFQRLGRFLGGPITAFIFGVIDAFSGAVTGFEETEGSLASKIFGGIMGAIGGFVSGFVGGILDLGKMLVGFVAGLFGFDDFKERLADFSFTDEIFDIVMKFKDAILGFVKDPLGSVKSIFGFGDDEEETPPPAPPNVKEGAKEKETGLQRALRKQEQARRSASGEGPKVTVTEPPPQTVLKTREATAPELKTREGDFDTPVLTPRSEMSLVERRASRYKSQLERNQERLGVLKENGSSTRSVEMAERRIADLQQKIKDLETQRQTVSAPTIVAPTTNTTNNSSSTALIGDGAPATDDLDRVA